MGHRSKLARHTDTAAAPARRTPRQQTAPATVAQPRRKLLAAALSVVLFLVYLSNLRVLSSGDNVPTRLLPFSILRQGNLDLDEFPRLRPEDGRANYYVTERNGHVYSGTPIATGVLITPLYIVPAWLLAKYDIPYDDVRAQLVFVIMERLVAAALTALSAGLIFIVLQRLVTQRWALAITLIYALGTSTWTFSGQALWTHVLSELGLAILCAIFLRPDARDEPSRAAYVVAGLTVAAIVANRPPMVAFGLLTTLFVWNYHRRSFPFFAALPVLGGVAVSVYNLSLYRSLVGGYGGINHFSTPLASGLAGLLFSPNRGLFIFTPILVFAFWGAIQVWRTDVHPWLRYMVVGVLLHVILYAKFDEWWAGYAFGPRYFTDIVPILSLLLVSGLVPLCRMRAAAVVCAALALYSVGVQVIGVYCDDGEWNRTPVSIERRPDRVWNWSDLHLVRALQSGWHGGELWPFAIEAFRDPVPARVGLLHAEDLANEAALENVPARLPPRGSQRVVASVVNRGTQAWPAFVADYAARGVVYLVVRWLADGQPIVAAGDVIRVPKNVCPGERVQIPFRLTAPGQSGQYQIELTVSQAVDGSRGVRSPNSYRFPIVVN